ncbi:hypothetical protein OG458_42490 (plasmid) [Streptomyces sp. NBC_01281]|uniref:hypothetical protein n=1 Tax=Streptomyces sp. NBC_01281 TaxID=2903811 RepID=UPI002E13FE0B|nr:hypothetical protein OG458_41315 [Streptomyces sp. NBC_01281]WSK66624.1 hypothetical protein OG458_42490 [Streptomyces sp. NBC_01281]
MSMSVPGPGPSYTKVQLSGPPDEVGRLMAALGSVGEIIFDSRSEPDARGDVSCTARVATHPSPRPVDPSVQQADVTVQSTFRLGTAAWPCLPGRAGAQQLEEAVDAVLAGLPGAGYPRSRVVAVIGSPASVEKD